LRNAKPGIRFPINQTAFDALWLPFRASFFGVVLEARNAFRFIEQQPDRWINVAGGNFLLTSKSPAHVLRRLADSAAGLAPKGEADRALTCNSHGLVAYGAIRRKVKINRRNQNLLSRIRLKPNACWRREQIPKEQRPPCSAPREAEM
jgi:hypothetical protein